MEDRPCQNLLERQLQDLLDRRRTNSTLRNLTLPKPGQIDFSSNDFLSLSTSSRLKAEYLAELQRTGLSLGSGGSRLLDGNSAYAENLEQEIASFHGAEAGLLFNSGFDANAGFFACVPQPGDVIVYDELVHASVHDGMRLSRARKRFPFRHNSVSGLREVLERVLQEDEGFKHHETNVIVAVEAIYSMDGDVAPLKEIADLVDDVLGKGRGYIVVDEAHSTGVLGPKGSGLVCELGLENRMFARLHTFGKSLAGNGGKSRVNLNYVLETLLMAVAYEFTAIILGSHTLRHYLINYARPLIYTTFLAYPSLTLIRSSYRLMQTGETVTLQTHLYHLTQTLFTSLHRLHSTSIASRKLLEIPSACPKSPIFAIHLQQPRDLATYLQDRGMMVRAVVPPTVPLGKQRVRVCLHAGNSVDEVDRLIRAVEEWCKGKMRETEEASQGKVAVHARL